MEDHRFVLGNSMDRPRFTYEQLVDGLKNDKFNKICFLTAKGESLKCWIPEFRFKPTGTIGV